MHSVFKNGFIQRKSFLCFVFLLSFLFLWLGCRSKTRVYIFFLPLPAALIPQVAGWGTSLVVESEGGAMEVVAPSCAPEFTAGFDA